MRIKSLLLTVLSIFITIISFAQDKIIKKNGEVIEAKVSQINQDVVVFKRFDNLEGPEYTIPKADVSRIKYKNGTEDIFEVDNDKIGVARKDITPQGVPIKGRQSMHDELGMLPNIVSVAPIVATESGIGIGVCFEHTLDARGIVNFYMPLFLSLHRSDNYGYNGYNETATMFYAMPGIKVYTNLNGRAKMKFSIGPSLIIAAGNTLADNYDYVAQTSSEEKQSRFKLGTMVNVGFSIFPSTHLYMGVDCGLGFCYLDQLDGQNNGFTGLSQFSIKIGYRYGHKKVNSRD